MSTECRLPGVLCAKGIGLVGWVEGWNGVGELVFPGFARLAPGGRKAALWF